MNIQKHRITYLSILLILIIIGAVIGGRMLLHKSSLNNRNETISNQEGVDYESEHLRRIDERCSQMSEKELLRYKSFCEKTLEKINLELDSDSLNPEERHENILSKCFIEQEFEIVKKHLQKLNCTPKVRHKTFWGHFKISGSLYKLFSKRPSLFKRVT